MHLLHRFAIKMCASNLALRKLDFTLWIQVNH